MERERFRVGAKDHLGDSLRQMHEFEWFEGIKPSDFGRKAAFALISRSCGLPAVTGFGLWMKVLCLVLLHCPILVLPAEFHSRPWQRYRKLPPRPKEDSVI